MPAIELWDDKPAGLPDLQRLRMDLHLSLMNANSALCQLFNNTPLTPDEIMLLHYIELYLGAAR